MKMLVDSGSYYTFIHPKIWHTFPQEIKDNLQPDDEQLHTATGDPIPVFGKVKITLRLGKVDILHSVRVADIETAGIIGMDLLSVHDSSIDLYNGQLKVYGVNVPVAVETDSVRCCRIAVATTTTIYLQVMRL